MENNSEKRYMFREHSDHMASIIYILGFIGTLYYNLSISTNFLMGLYGFLKALVWPAFLMYSLFKHMGV